MARADLPAGTVTFLFTDVDGSTRLLRELGDVGYAAALAEHRRLLRDAFRTHGGVEVDTQGDAFFFVFPTAQGALAGAAQGGHALEPGPVRVRMGLHTGTPHLDGDGYVGSDVHMAARIAASGHGGQVVLSKATRDLAGEGLQDLGEHRLKDFEEPVWIFQLGSERFPPLKTISNTNLPRPVSAFVGRIREREHVRAMLLDGARLVTLSGPGGTGKTRLSVEVATELVPEFRNGVYWVGLATLRDPALVSQAIAQTVGAKDGLAEHIGERELLLLLDNFEQVVDAAAEVSSLLSGCPNLRVLVTSRELLRVQGEREYAVPPLARDDAVALFCERSGLEPDATIAELCARLEELPLALELAAARASVLSPAQMLARLAQRLDLLKGGRDADPRQQTLRAAIAWSHDLLDPGERSLFARLSVFRGGCTLDAAEEVADAELDMLQSLVDKSLLRHTNERFWMLETIREYALERLAESGAQAELRRRHTDYFLRHAEEAWEADSEQEVYRLLAREHDNLRLALEEARDLGEDETLLRLTAALARFWSIRGFVREASPWLALALERGSSPPLARMEVLRAAAAVARVYERDLARAEALNAEWRRAAERAGDDAELRHAMKQAAGFAEVRGDLDGARAGYLAVQALADEAGDRGMYAAMEVNVGLVDMLTGDFGSALRHSEAAADIFRELGEESGLAVSLQNCGWSALRLGDHGRAEASFREALVVAGGMGWVFMIGILGLALGAVNVARGEAERGVQLLGAAAAIREELETGFNDALEKETHERAVADAKAALGDEAFSAAWARGDGMTPDEIVQFCGAA